MTKTETGCHGEPENPRLRPDPVGVYAEGGKAFLVVSTANMERLAGCRTLHVSRGKKALGLTAPGERLPMFLADLEAELDLRLSREVEVIVIDPGETRRTGTVIRLLWS